MNEPPKSSSRKASRLRALGQMGVVTLLWSSSFPIHKALMNDGMPPLSLAGYRYFLAAIILLFALGLRSRMRPATETPSGSPGTGEADSQQSSGALIWLMAPAIGFFMYTAQGVHMTALSLIPASDSGLVMMTTMPVAVAILVSIIEKDTPSRAQLFGLGIVITGIFVYFPHDLGGARLAGILLNVLSATMGAVATVLTHVALTRMKMPTLKLTTISMLSGGGLLFVIALLHDNFYVPGLVPMLWILLLALINTAFAFALFNHTLKTLGAFEVTIFQDSMIVQIGILSAIFLGEAITPAMALGMMVVIVGIIVVQYFSPERRHAGES
jgi:drug/metabolite transporter (DMT)-like permease